MNLRLAAALLLLGLCWLPARPAAAIPVFAHRFGVTCQTCHTTVPQLTEFGQAFLERGYRWPGDQRPGKAAPVAVKVNLVYSTAADPGGLPKAIVDEIEILSGGALGKHASYFVEQYAVDGGRAGSTRDAWVSYDAGRLNVRAGQFTLPLPVDPESFRQTLNHYAVFDQTAGANPFNFFDPRQGLDLGMNAGGFEAHALVLNGHDPQSGLPRSGLDTMLTAALARGAFTLSAYRYGGARRIGDDRDRFERHGAGVQWQHARLRADAVWQLGNDSAAGDGRGQHISGGFVQARYEASPRWSFLGRLDATADGNGIGRSITGTLVYRPARNMRLTLEDVVARGKHTMTTGWLFAY